MAGNIRRNRNNELLSELEAVQRALASQTVGGPPSVPGPPGPQGDPGEDFGGTLGVGSLVGTVPSGELGGTWADPTVNATHSGSAHAVLLLRASSGTYTATIAANVDTYAVSGLTTLDSLLLFINTKMTDNTGGVTSVYHVTDAMTLKTLNALSTGQGQMATVTIRPSPNNASIYMVREDGHGAVGLGSLDFAVTSEVSHPQATATAFTGSWTIALRTLGVTAGGTYHWSWAVYKVVGQ